MELPEPIKFLLNAFPPENSCTKSCLGCIRGIKIPRTDLTANAPSQSRGHTAPEATSLHRARAWPCPWPGAEGSPEPGLQTAASSPPPDMGNPTSSHRAAADLEPVQPACSVPAATPHVLTQSRNPPAPSGLLPARGLGSLLRRGTPCLARSPLCSLQRHRGQMPSAGDPRGPGKTL